MGRSNNSFNSWSGQANIQEVDALSAEQRLFVAVLSQAVHDAFSTHVDAYDRNNARTFLLSDSYHFRLICEFAGRNPEYVTSRMKRIIAKGWDIESMPHALTRKAYRKSTRGKKPGPKKHVTGNAYYKERRKRHAELSL